MLENLPDRVDQLARMTVLIDAGDLDGLVSLRGQAVALAAELDSDHAAEFARMTRQIGELAEAIVMRQVPDADVTFREIGAVVEKLQKATSGTSLSEEKPEQNEPDDELIVAWIGGCEAMLADLEGWLLALERSPTDSEVIGDIRRTMHTLKGECGVLSLHTSQRLCHEAESLIDIRLQAGLPVPIDPLLMLLDWLRVYTNSLAMDRTAKPDDGKRVMDAILGARLAPAQVASDQSPPFAPQIDCSIASVAQLPMKAAASVTGAAAAVNPMRVQFAAQAGTEENLTEFLCEAKDHLACSEEALLALDRDHSNIELINTVFRAFHTIKGVAGFMALGPIVTLAHSAEQLLDGARSGTVSLGRIELDLILATCDLMTQLLSVLEGAAGPMHCDLDTLVSKLNAAAAAPADSAVADEPQTSKTTTLVPTAQVAAERVPSEHNAVIETKTSAPQRALVAEVEGASKAKKTDQTVKVSTTRMDSLVTMVGELVIAQQMVAQDVRTLGGAGSNSQRVQRTLAHMSKMIRELQEVSMSLRMVNLKGTFQKMTRLVRDVSQKAGKQIEVITEGEDVELDRNVVEAITDPLVHMIRNSCDHGVEDADQRIAAGKEPAGQVALRAYHAGGSIVIEISDDGRGLSREKLLAKAKAKGILPPDTDDASMPDSEVFAIIFLPGFSTAEKVTDISGRGVGMDVVRRNIEALRGKIEIRSTIGKGTTFLMRLPLTMAIIDGMVVRVGTQRYVLPTLSIQQSFRPKADDIKTAVGVGEMVNVRGSMLPIYRLSRVLELKEGLSHIEEGLLIVIEADDSRFCLMVDEILGQYQVVIKTLTQTAQQLRGVSGGAILGDGRVALILDVAQIASLAREAQSSPNPAFRVEGSAEVLCNAM